MYISFRFTRPTTSLGLNAFLDLQLHRSIVLLSNDHLYPFAFLVLQLHHSIVLLSNNHVYILSLSSSNDLSRS